MAAFTTRDWRHVAKSFRIRLAGRSTRPSASQSTPNSFGYPGPTPSISANSTLDPIVWIIDRGSGQLPRRREQSFHPALEQQPKPRRRMGSAVKFTVATPLNGRVYVGTADRLISYGPPVPPTSGPAARRISSLLPQAHRRYCSPGSTTRTTKTGSRSSAPATV